MKIKINLSGTPVTLQVPDGMDPGEFAEQVEARHMGQEDYSAASDSGFENFAAGLAQGPANIGRQIGNVVGAISDEDMAQYKSRDQDLLDTGAGQAGSLVGEIAASAPVGLGVARGASSLAGRVAPRLAKALANPAAVAALDNAATGALVAGPGNRAEGAVKGAAISGVMSGAGKVLKRAVMQPWVNKTAEAKALENMTGHSIPLSQSAEPGIWKQIYEGLVSNIPGSGGKLRGQYEKALQDFREYVVEEATPPGMNRIPKVGSHDMQRIMGDLQQAWDNKYQSFTINQYPIKYDVDTPREIYKRMPSVNRGIPKKGNVVLAEDLMALRTDVQKIIDELPPKEDALARKLMAYKNQLWDNIKADIDPTGRGKTAGGKELKEYEALAPYYNKFLDVKTAAQKSISKNSEFTPEQLAKATNQRAGAGGVAGKGAFSQEAKVASSALKGFPSRQGVFQTAAAMGMTAAAVGGNAVAGPAGAGLALAAPVALGKTLASKRTQRALAGELPFQKKAAAAINARKGLLKKTARVLGKAATITATGE
jgi:hypothetical protein